MSTEEQSRPLGRLVRPDRPIRNIIVTDTGRRVAVSWNGDEGYWEGTSEEFDATVAELLAQRREAARQRAVLDAMLPRAAS